MKRPARALLATIAAALALVGPGASAAPALAANHEIILSGFSPLTVGQPTVISAKGVVAPPAEFWDASWIEVVAISGTLLRDCPGDAGSAGSIAEETGGTIIEIALRPYADEAGNFVNSVGFTPRAAGPVLICGYLYNEVGYTWAGSTLRLEVVGSGPGSQAPGGRGSTGTGPVNVRPPWVTRAGRRLVCHPGTWSGATGSYAYRWLLDGHETRVKGPRPPAPGAASRGHRVSCRVTAFGSGGSAAATSRPVRLR